ncbi:hypothetical protein B0H16DRAFT_1806002 [Mycena metata]|uniref:Uncharacterized protein n=1 Tax=Mycena metata TaxID=1033252 RepID=A0AAD7JEP9_9AGAR|nr:hypothetical protein B0H16DRAFT_1806002 [Mycena metata]
MDSPTPDARLPPPATSTSTGGILGSFLGRGRPRNSSQSHIDVPALNRSPSPPSHGSPHPHHGLGAMNPFAGLAAHERDARDARDCANANAASVAASGLGIPAFSGTSGAPFSNAAPQPGGNGNGNGGGGNGGGSNRRRPAPAAVVVAPSPSNQSSGGGLNLSHMLRRRRSAGNVATPAPGGVPPTPTLPITASRTGPPAASGGNTSGGGGGQTHRIRLVPHLDSRRSLRFHPISRDFEARAVGSRVEDRRVLFLLSFLLVSALPGVLGFSTLVLWTTPSRFTDRSGLGLAAVNALNGSKIAFKSKVVSRSRTDAHPPTQSRSSIRPHASRLSFSLTTFGPLLLPSLLHAIPFTDLLARSRIDASFHSFTVRRFRLKLTPPTMVTQGTRDAETSTTKGTSCSERVCTPGNEGTSLRGSPFKVRTLAPVPFPPLLTYSHLHPTPTHTNVARHIGVTLRGECRQQRVIVN